jgi:glyoxylase-like metal-dependent hydrolase (beta-lactamase superfamily II)
MSGDVDKTLHELGNGIYAYTQLPGSWGWSNSGLIVDGDQTLLVDTLFDLKITQEMLDTMRRAVPAAKRIGTVVNTHGNGDHCYGNALLVDSEIIGTQGCVEDLEEGPASRNALLMRAGRIVDGMGTAGWILGGMLKAVGIDRVALLAEVADFALPTFGDFEFSGIATTPPNRVFEGELQLRVGDKEVLLIELGPAHTRGDAVVYVAGDKTLFTGDLLFKDAHPIIWEGPVSNWTAALRRLLDMDIETVVPGHGPVGDKSGLRETLHYLEVLTAEARRRYDAGMSLDDAVRDMALDEFKGWLDPERIYINTHCLYREFNGDESRPDVLALLAKTARLKKERF